MSKSFPYKPLADPRNLVVPRPSDKYFSHRDKRDRIQRQRQIEAWREEQQERGEPDEHLPSDS